jgi:LmbE family N-acetylglucosaminyl deacetylase
MNEFVLRTQVRQLLRYIMDRLMSEICEDDMKRSALVFAPHPDDETLGCGGTIIKKKRSRAEVRIIFVTDGSRSHLHCLSESELKSIRNNEALAASRILGLEDDKVIFLELEDGNLSKNLESSAKRVSEILAEHQPEEIFIPYYRDKDPNSDHIATNNIVMSALQTYRMETVIYEYPIWSWNHWPWVSQSMPKPSKILRLLKRNFVISLSLLRDIRCSIYIGDVLELKRTALNQHKSQVTRFIPNSNWKTLHDVANGEWLECFFQDHEVFYRYFFP